jgi:putative SOS response-associated peptidase YedK
MCGRYKLTRTDKALLAHQFGLREEEIPDYADELDNAPGSWRSVIDAADGERKWTNMRWGYAMEVTAASPLARVSSREDGHRHDGRCKGTEVEGKKQACRR